MFLFSFIISVKVKTIHLFIQVTDKKNMTPIHLACIYGHADIDFEPQSGGSVFHAPPSPGPGPQGLGQR